MFGRITTCNGNLATLSKDKKQMYFVKSLPLQLPFSSHCNDHRTGSKSQTRSHFRQRFPSQEGIHTPAGDLAVIRTVLWLAGVPGGAKCSLIDLPHS